MSKNELREKYANTLPGLVARLKQKEKESKKALHSRDWMGDFYNDSLVSHPVEKEGMLEKVIRLAQAKRAISNFVRIITDRNIPVRYNTGDLSYTDGNSVVLTSKISNQNFDAVVGISLHEAAHIKLSDFTWFKEFRENPPLFIPPEMLEKAGKIGLNSRGVQQNLFGLMNIIEDRRIDRWIYRTAPGYRPYYIAMYKEYWHSKEIDKMLLSDLYRDLSLESYMNRITNISNDNFVPGALPDLDKIVNIIDLRNIERLNNDEPFNKRTRKLKIGKKMDPQIGMERITQYYDISDLPKLFQVAHDVFSIILDNILTIESTDSKNGDESGEKTKGTGSGSGSSEKDSSDDELGDDEEIEIDLDDSDEDNNEDSDDDKDDELQDPQDEDLQPRGRPKVERDENGKAKIKISKKALKKALAKQKNFIEGNVRKIKISQRLAKEIDTIEQAQAKIQEVGTTVSKGARAKCIVTQKLTMDIIQSDTFPYGIGSKGTDFRPEMEQAVLRGLARGKILAQKLSIRNDENSMKFIRQNAGKMERRLIPSLGYGAENVFSVTRHDKFRPINLHLTIDASGSMSGDKWYKSISTAAALCQAADLIRNIDVSVSIRSGEGDYAYISYIYDSRKDKISKVRNLWKYLHTAGSTPEGLAFEAIKDSLMKISNGQNDVYFINFSDGEPAFSTGDYFYSRGRQQTGKFRIMYSGDSAATHTKAQVQELRESGFKIISYFICDSRYGVPDSSKRLFQKMYGQDAEFIDVDSIPGLIRTLNKLFLAKK